MQPVHTQRNKLCDLLDSLNDEQWQATTMCEGWDAGDIAAHMLVREREPWYSVGLVIPQLGDMHTSRMAVRKAAGRAAMIADLRAGPPRPFAWGIVGRVQVGEDYIHTEDVRRGGATDAPAGDGQPAVDLTPDDGTGDDRVANILWEAVSRFSLQTFGGVKADGVVALTDGTKTKAYRVGGKIARPARNASPAETVSISAPVGDLLLFTTGRRGAHVSIDGPEDLSRAVSHSRRQV